MFRVQLKAEPRPRLVKLESLLDVVSTATRYYPLDVVLGGRSLYYEVKELRQPDLAFVKGVNDQECAASDRVAQHAEKSL